MMQHAKDMTVNYGGQSIKDCVITVPSHFTQHERRALYTAAEIADLRVLSLIEENTAAALHFGIDRVFETPHTVLYYNMGAATTQVSIVTYSSYLTKDAGKNKTVGQFEVVGKGWDSSLGGFNFDVKLAELLADRFNEAWGKKASGKGKDLKDFFRPMTRLRLEANKIKEVLSANMEFPVKAEQLHAETDLNTKVTRAEFEAACESLFARLTAPIDAALANANMTLDSVQAVELLGGGVRMPRVKKILDDYFKASKLEIGQHLNGDEAMALGAAFRAANLSTAFRVRKVGIVEPSSFGVSVQLESLPAAEKKSGGLGGFFGLGGKKKEANKEGEAGEAAWVKQTSLFSAKTSIPSRPKTVAFNHDQDILCRIEYDNTSSLSIPSGTDNLIAVYNITGIAEFAQETASKGLGPPKVHLSFSLDLGGLVQLSKAEATLELPAEPEEEEKVEGGIEGAVDAEAAADSKAGNETDAASTEKKEGEEGEATAAAAESEAGGEGKDAEEAGAKDDKKAQKESSKKKAKKTKKDKKKAKTDNTLRRLLVVSENRALVTPPSWPASQISEAKSRLRALDAADDARRKREAALNDLEGYSYKVKNRLTEEEDELKKVSTDEQRQEVIDLCNTTEEWLYDEGRSADMAAYKAKQKEITKIAEPIFFRFAELTARPAAVKQATKDLTEVRTKVGGWAESKPHITDVEKEKLLEAVTAAEAWIAEKEAAQALVKAHEAPVFESADVPQQLKAVGVQYEKLLKKPKPAPVVEKVNATANATASAANSTTTEEQVHINVNATEAEAKGAEAPAADEKEAGVGEL